MNEIIPYYGIIGLRFVAGNYTMALPLSTLIKRMEEICPLPESLKLFLATEPTRVELKKKHVLLKPGRICDHVYYIEKGMLGSYKIENDKPKWIWFMMEGDIATSIPSFNFRQPSEEYIVALEPCVVHTFAHDTVIATVRKYTEFDTIERHFKNYYYDFFARLGEARQGGSKILYNFLESKYGHNLFRIKIPVLASFMGIVESTLHEVRKGRHG